MAMQNSSVRRLIVLTIMAYVLAISPFSRAVTILSGPSFTPAPNAPLAGTLQLTTDVNSRVSVLVSDGTSIWEKDFYDFGTTHSETLVGFKPGRTNLILITVFDMYRNAYTAGQLLTFVTAPLPANFPTSVVLQNEPDRMEPGYTLFMVQNRTAHVNYIDIVDNSGQVVWYKTAPALYDVDVRQLDNGDLFVVDGSANRFLEINMLGNTVKTWNAPAGYPVDQHDGFVTDHGTILFISQSNRTVSNFPSSDVVSNSSRITVTVGDSRLVEISATNTNPTLLNVWSPLNMLDPTHITYLTYETSHGSYTSGTVDNEHGNAVLEDTNDDSIIASLRNQNAVFKFTRTGQLKWILSPPANWSTNLQPYLLKPVGTPFEWNYGQHAPMVSPQGTLFLYDDGNLRASPFDSQIADQDNYSRGVEFSIDETNMQVSQVWDTTQADEDRLYTPIIGKTQWLPQTRDVLVTYGYVTYINGVHPSSHAANATMVRVIEYTHDPIPQVVFDLSFFDYSNTSSSYLGYFLYRAIRIPDLYAHPSNSITDLVVNNENGRAHLEFSADPTLSYVVEASTDLKSWTPIGTPVEAGGVGNFDFDDLSASQFAVRYYRVVAQ
jgi:arylsulfate sulfotransferase